MSPFKVLGIILIVAGLVVLAYGGFTYTHQSHAAELGPIKVSVSEKRTVPVPVWAGIGAVVIGALLLIPRERA